MTLFISGASKAGGHCQLSAGDTERTRAGSVTSQIWDFRCLQPERLMGRCSVLRLKILVSKRITGALKKYDTLFFLDIQQALSEEFHNFFISFLELFFYSAIFNWCFVQRP